MQVGVNAPGTANNTTFLACKQVADLRFGHAVRGLLLECGLGQKCPQLQLSRRRSLFPLMSDLEFSVTSSNCEGIFQINPVGSTSLKSPRRKRSGKSGPLPQGDNDIKGFALLLARLWRAPRPMSDAPAHRAVLVSDRHGLREGKSGGRRTKTSGVAPEGRNCGSRAEIIETGRHRRPERPAPH